MFVKHIDMRNKIIILVAAIVLLGSGYIVYSSNQKNNPSPDMMEDKQSMDDGLEKPELETMNKEDQDMTQDEMIGDKMIKFPGTVLAGTSAPLIDFNHTDFEKALASDKLVVLYFYANWCPICRVEFPRMQDAFNELTSDKVVAFRVNYNDSDTDDDEVALAREHGVAYQHTKVFVKGHERILKSPESWDKSRYLAEIEKYD